MRPYVDKAVNEEAKTDLFAAWGRKAEKLTPIEAMTIAEAFDDLVTAAGPHIAAARAAPAPVTPIKTVRGASRLAPAVPVQHGATALSSQQQHMAMQVAAAQMYMAQQLMTQQQAMVQQQAAQMMAAQMVAAQMAMASAAGGRRAKTGSAAGWMPAVPALPGARPERGNKAFRIVNPESGEAIFSSATPAAGMNATAKEFKMPSAPAAVDTDATAAGASTVWERKTLKIVDPRSGEPIAGISSSGMRVDARAFVPPSGADDDDEDDASQRNGPGLEPGDYKPAFEHKAFKIVDPKSGDSIEVLLGSGSVGTQKKEKDDAAVPASPSVVEI